ncbi:hypothetical protein CEXT_231 [Caerostris extrusa]|uniref:Uncharacterized protein n=1 Tax=Caerostris extrusa TaxID=172846 RepID=A0AAV4RU37_CAEEX|nr:hypothetical protein CEXT_231 [Caerostris extrusa]
MLTLTAPDPRLSKEKHVTIQQFEGKEVALGSSTCVVHQNSVGFVRTQLENNTPLPCCIPIRLEPVEK